MYEPILKQWAEAKRQEQLLQYQKAFDLYKEACKKAVDLMLVDTVDERKKLMQQKTAEILERANIIKELKIGTAQLPTLPTLQLEVLQDTLIQGDYKRPIAASAPSIVEPQHFNKNAYHIPTKSVEQRMDELENNYLQLKTEMEQKFQCVFDKLNTIMASLSDKAVI